MYERGTFNVVETQIVCISTSGGYGILPLYTAVLVCDSGGGYQGFTLIAVKSPYGGTIPYNSEKYKLYSQRISTPNGGIVASVPPNSEWVIRLIGD